MRAGVRRELRVQFLHLYLVREAVPVPAEADVHVGQEHGLHDDKGQGRGRTAMTLARRVVCARDST